MATYFASDVHLRLDHPERAERFARWVRTKTADDAIYIVGDLCDFWFAARQSGKRPLTCPGLLALAEFVGGGGSLTVLPGNHDAWLGPFFQSELGAQWREGPVDLDFGPDGPRCQLVHGHLLGGRATWKGWMESDAFFQGFRALPHPVARGFEFTLDQFNEARLEASHSRHIAVYRAFVDAMTDPPDLMILGHVHQTLDEVRPNGTRLVVLGNWHQQSSYVRQEGGRAEFLIEKGPMGPQ